MQPLDAIPDISVTIAGQEFPLRARAAGMVRLIALHQSAISATPSLKVTFDCGPSTIELSVQPKLARLKVRR